MMQSSDEHINNKYDRILQLIKNNPIEREYFFRKLANAVNPFEWFIPIKNAGFLDPRNNPSPKEISDNSKSYRIIHWEVLDSVKNIAEKNIKNPTSVNNSLLIEFIDSVIDYKDASGNRIDNYRTDWMVTKIIFLLPFELIKEKHISFICQALKSSWDNSLIVDEIHNTIIPTLIANSHTEYLLKIVDHIFDFKSKESTGYSDEYDSILDHYWLKELMDTYRERIAKLCSNEGVKIIENKIKLILSQDDSQFNIIWIPNLNEHEQNHFMDRYEIQLIFFIRDCLIDSEHLFLSTKLNQYINEQHSIFKRLAIRVIDVRYDEFSNMLWELNVNPLNFNSVKHELYIFFQNHCKDFCASHINKIIQWIESQDFTDIEESNEPENTKEIYKAYRKKEWLNSLLISNHPLVLSTYRIYDSINPAPLEHPGFDYWMESGTWQEKPISTKTREIFERTNIELSEFLQSVTLPTTRSVNLGTEKYDKYLREQVLQNPIKYFSDLMPFLDCSLIYQKEIIRASFELWKDNKEIDWENIFVFVKEAISKNDFWTLKYADNEYNLRNALIEDITDLIEEGTKHDNHAFSEKLLPVAKAILFLIDTKLDYTQNIISDLHTNMLNSPRSRLYDALLNYSLRYARIFKHEESNKFEEDVLLLFQNKILDEKDLFFRYTLGKYLPNIFWLNKEWIITNLPILFNYEAMEKWEYAVEGYYCNSRTVYKEVYFELKKLGILSKVVQYNFHKARSNSAAIHQACISFLNSWESLNNDNCLLQTVIDSKNLSAIKEIATFIIHQKDYINENNLKSILIALLKYIYRTTATLEVTEELKEVYSELNRWLAFVDTMDEDLYNIYKLTLIYCSKRFNTLNTIKEFSRIVKNSPTEIIDLLIILIQYDEKHFYYNKEQINLIIDEIVSHELYDGAITICNKLIQKGCYEFKSKLEMIKERKGS